MLMVGGNQIDSDHDDSDAEHVIKDRNRGRVIHSKSFGYVFWTVTCVSIKTIRIY